nr:hypothetical protein BaRGS_008150 [Batillaria attramentaria]
MTALDDKFAKCINMTPERTDQRGMNLNRMYLDPSVALHPAIYASKSLLVYHHVENRVRRESGEPLDIRVDFPCDAGEREPKLANDLLQVENMVYPKLIAVNTAHFDFSGCNFSERNMYLKDKRDGLSKEGSGRVAIHKAIGIIHSYTLECNYNTGRLVNPIPPANGDDGRATPPPLAGFPPKYMPAHYEDVGKAVAIAALDLNEVNPWSRLTLSEHCSLFGIKDWVRRYLRSMRGGPRLPRNPSIRSMNRNGNNGQPGRGEQSNTQMNSRGSNSRLTGQDNTALASTDRPRKTQPELAGENLAP